MTTNHGDGGHAGGARLTAAGGAVLSDDRQYRYRLSRPVGGPFRGTCLFIMFNPSTADETVDDPTIRRCRNFAHDWGYDRLEVVNLFAFRATKPAELRKAHDPVGPDNDRHILEAAREADMVIAAWGQHGRLYGRSGKVRQMLINEGIPAHHLRRSKDGQPMHPLYLPADLIPQPLDTPAGRAALGIQGGAEDDPEPVPAEVALWRAAGRNVRVVGPDGGPTLRGVETFPSGNYVSERYIPTGRYTEADAWRVLTMLAKAYAGQVGTLAAVVQEAHGKWSIGGLYEDIADKMYDTPEAALAAAVARLAESEAERG